MSEGDVVSTSSNSLPLAGVRVLEIGGMGPGPFAGMLLADIGAEVVRIERPGGPGVFPGQPQFDLLNRGKYSVALDLKSASAVEALLSMVPAFDILLEGHRPGVAERLGIGPDECQSRHPRLVYGRMTGWGQDGPLAHRAGHDVSYIAVTGALHAIGDAGRPPQIPLNLLGDFGGGGTYLVMGVLAALLEARAGAPGRVVDAAIVDGATHLLAGTLGMFNAGAWTDDRGCNMLDGAAPYYTVYETADGEHMAVGAIEAKFYAELVNLLGVDVDVAVQHDRSAWPTTRAALSAAFATKTQAQWIAVFDGSDACVSPVLGLRAAADHEHIAARGSLLAGADGILQPGRAPRFSGAGHELPAQPRAYGADTRKVLDRYGVDSAALLAEGVALQA